MHTADARAHGETEQRIYLVAAWHEAPVYTPRERAALAWTDALTRLSQGHTQKEAREALEAHFTPEEQMNQTVRSEEHTSELQSLMRISYAVFCLKKK